MSEHAIRIPRSSPDATEATLIDFLVEEGGQATEGQPLFTIATDKVEIEIEAGVSGTVHWTAELESDYDIGAEIGIIETEG
jgi:pyruvate/2-oxoglutarate dehydrogenase complex dihydrolipoamide acyltransferase (E2) component